MENREITLADIFLDLQLTYETTGGNAVSYYTSDAADE